MKSLIDKLYEQNSLSSGELLELLGGLSGADRDCLIEKAAKTRFSRYGSRVFMRGLIEFTNCCKRNCLYCGLRASNLKAERYRLSKEQILGVCEEGRRLGFHTFVLQGGEDDYFNDERVVDIVGTIKKRFPECAVTLSFGERPRSSYEKYFEAGADRYLLRHETASGELYGRLHPGMGFESRKQCLLNLKDIGFQVGAGFMVGLPGQTNEDIVKDLVFLKEFQPHMVGIGPFIPHKDTPLGGEAGGTAEVTVTILAIVRLLLPDVLLPATTALGTIDEKGREKALKAGANVVMPNLSPADVRAKYALYNGKKFAGDEAAECLRDIRDKVLNAGFSVDMSRGDQNLWTKRPAVNQGAGATGIN